MFKKSLGTIEEYLVSNFLSKKNIAKLKKPCPTCSGASNIVTLSCIEYNTLFLNKENLTRAVTGVFGHPTPQVFRRYLTKVTAECHRFWHFFSRIRCENLRSRSLKVRSPDHVKWPHLRKSLNARHSYTNWSIALNLSTINIRNSIYKTLYLYIHFDTILISMT